MTQSLRAVLSHSLNALRSIAGGRRRYRAVLPVPYGRDRPLPPAGEQTTAGFDMAHYRAINEARMNHLAALNLPLDGRSVLDVGSGPGDLAQFFVRRGCKVTCVDGREENIARLKEKHPGLPAFVADVEKQSLDKFGAFDVVFCYGLLYHVENPVAALRNIASACKDTLLLETMVCDHALPVFRLVDEPMKETQALRGLACRPSPSFIAMVLDRIGFPYVYMTNSRPDHRDFRYRWFNNLDWNRRSGHLRAVFVASREELHNALLERLARAS